MPVDPTLAAAIAAGETKADEVLTRRNAAHVTRAAALAAHPNRMNLSVQLSDSAGAPLAPAVSRNSAGFLLAAGDSWFDYPCYDVLKKLEDQHGYNVESSAHAGASIEALAYLGGQLDKFGRCLDKILSQGATPKAVLLSGGGDDIAGREFGMLLNNASSPIAGWNNGILQGLIDQRVRLAYAGTIGSINRLCMNRLNRLIPIFLHGYDHPVPDGRGFLGGFLFLPGPWLKPGFDEKLFNNPTLPSDSLQRNADLMTGIIDRLNTMLAALAADAAFTNLHYLDLRGTLSNVLAHEAYKRSWNNELHPTESGFSSIAAKFAAQLDQLP